MSEKRIPYIILVDTAAIIGYTYHGDASVPDFHGDRGGTRIDGIFQKLLNNA